MVVFRGNAGVGKSAMAKALTAELEKKADCVVIALHRLPNLSENSNYVSPLNITLILIPLSVNILIALVYKAPYSII